MPQNNIRVVNAAGVTISRTTLKAARRMIEHRGIARWRGSAVEMIESDHRVVTSPKLLTNGSGMASVEAIKGLPVAGDVIRLLMGPRRPVQDRPTITLSVRALPLTTPVPPVPLWRGVPMVEAQG